MLSPSAAGATRRDRGSRRKRGRLCGSREIPVPLPGVKLPPVAAVKFHNGAAQGAEPEALHVAEPVFQRSPPGVRCERVKEPPGA